MRFELWQGICDTRKSSYMVSRLWLDIQGIFALLLPACKLGGMNLYNTPVHAKPFTRAEGRLFEQTISPENVRNHLYMDRSASSG